MRKLMLSAFVILASAAYVALDVTKQDDGFQGLVDRVLFRDAKPQLPPLDLDDPLFAAPGTPLAVPPPDAAGGIP